MGANSKRRKMWFDRQPWVLVVNTVITVGALALWGYIFWKIM